MLTSGQLAGRSSVSIAAARKVVCPTMGATLIAGGEFLQRLQIVGEPRITKLALIPEQFEWGRKRPPGHERRNAEAAIAHDHGRDALRDLRRHRGGGQGHPVVVRMDIDEARREHQPVRVYPFLALPFASSPMAAMRPSATATSHLCPAELLPSITRAP